MPDDRLTPEELAAVQARYPVSQTVANLSLGVPKNACGMIPASCEAGPVNTGHAQGNSPHEPATTDVRPAASPTRRRTRFQSDSAREAAKLERNPRHGTVGEIPVQKGIGGKFLVRVTAIRCRLLDEDNMCEKYHVDLCRYSGALPSDAPGTAKIEVRQQKVEPGAAEEVRIEIFKL